VLGFDDRRIDEIKASGALGEFVPPRPKEVSLGGDVVAVE